MKIGEKLLSLGRRLFSGRKLKGDSGNYCWWVFFEPKKPNIFN